ncbi:MAG: RNHCP domain-containing protein [Candidatus Micrarchaeaceae archaeon]
MVQQKRFIKRKENFICKHCGMHIKGNGYTDHCPYCLWSLHVDINPGDRQSNCGGLMKPIRTIYENSSIIIYYKCTKCNIMKRVKAAKDDNEELLYALANKKQ